MGKLCSVVKVWGLLLYPAIHCNVCSALLLWFSLMTSSSMSVSASGELACFREPYGPRQLLQLRSRVCSSLRPHRRVTRQLQCVHFKLARCPECGYQVLGQRREGSHGCSSNQLSTSEGQRQHHLAQGSPADSHQSGRGGCRLSLIHI